MRSMRVLFSLFSRTWDAVWTQDSQQPTGQDLDLNPNIIQTFWRRLAVVMCGRGCGGGRRSNGTRLLWEIPHTPRYRGKLRMLSRSSVTPANSATAAKYTQRQSVLHTNACAHKPHHQLAGGAYLRLTSRNVISKCPHYISSLCYPGLCMQSAAPCSCTSRCQRCSQQARPRAPQGYTPLSPPYLNCVQCSNSVSFRW